MCDRIHSYVSHDSLKYATQRIHMCDTNQSYVSHDSFICDTWLIHVCDNDLFICVARIIDMCHTTHSHVWHESICVTWLIHMCHMTHSYVWHDSFICVSHDSLIRVTQRIHMCDMNQSHVLHDSFICATWFIDMCHTIHSHSSHDSSIWGRIWRNHMRHIIHMRHNWIICVMYIWNVMLSCICITWHIWLVMSHNTHVTHMISYVS